MLMLIDVDVDVMMGCCAELIRSKKKRCLSLNLDVPNAE
jgi:hypothetical protein